MKRDGSRGGNERIGRTEVARGRGEQVRGEGALVTDGAGKVIEEGVRNERMARSKRTRWGGKSDG